MSRWWDTEAADAGQALYGDPALAVQAASMPDVLTRTTADYKHDVEQARKDKGGFLGTLTGALGKADAFLSNIPGWGITKNALWFPIDKTASGMYWAYSNVVSQPLSTLLLQAGKSDVTDRDIWTSGKEWGDAYHRAEHISPGQAFMNYENVKAATGDPGGLAPALGLAEAPDTASLIFSGDNWKYKGPLSTGEQARVSQQMERFLYDTKYWQDKSNWKYDVGSGGLDFFFNIYGDPLAPAVGAVSGAVKASRSIKFVADEAQSVSAIPFKKGQVITATEGPGIRRTHGAVMDMFKRGETPEEVAQLPSMQKAFDWMKEEGRTTEEIANHPMFGRGRRINPERYTIARTVQATNREDMELLWRFAAGDSLAGKELAGRGSNTLKNVGRIADNRELVDSLKINPDMVSAFKAEEEGSALLPRDENLLFEPPSPRPPDTEPIRQAGWDKRWGRLQQQSDMHRQIAKDITESPLKVVNPAERTSLADALKAEQWKTAKMQTIADDYDEMINKEKYYGNILGRMDDAELWSPSASPLFGTMGKSYRMGGLAVRDTELSAEKAALKSAQGKGNRVKGGNFVMTTLKRGMAAPIRVIHTFGERTPEGFVNHNADDARDRVFNMLKQVDGLAPEDRLSLIEKYNAAGDKVSRSAALDDIHTTVLKHVISNTNNLDPEVGRILTDAIKDGIASSMTKLTKPKAQAFGPKAETPEDISKLTGLTGDELANAKPVRSDRVVAEEDGVGHVISPLAQTQLNDSDILMPIKEINRLVKRSSGSMQTMRRAGGNAADVVFAHLDGFSTLWKFATLMRPGYVPRMVSDEILGRMWKTGGLSTLLDTSKGMGHFFENRARQVWAISGKGSYVPTTGKGIASKHAIVRLEDDDVVKAAIERGDDVKKVKVPLALRMSYGRLQDETDELANARKEWEAAKADKASTPDYISSLESKMESHQDAIKEYNDYISEILRTAETSKGRRIGDGSFEYAINNVTYKVPQAFSEEWDNPIPRDQISSDDAWKSLFSRGESLDRERYFSHAEKTGAYTMVEPTAPNHMQSWLDAVNKQMRQDPFHRMVAQGKSDRELMTWLHKTGEGRQYMSRMGYWNRNPEQFVRGVRYMMDKYLNDEALRLKLANNEPINENELRAAFSTDEFPIVHGEEIKEVSALNYKETAAHYRDKFMDKSWKHMATIPGDLMSRHPLYLQLHQSTMQDLIRQQYHYKMSHFGDDSISPKEWEEMNNKADKIARKQMSQVVYDPIDTTGAHALRFVYPFFKAHIDALDRWAGLIAERPEQLGKFAKIYNAPVAANLVTDEQGNHVGMDGLVEHVDPTTGEKTKEFVPLSKRILNLRAPWAKSTGKTYASLRMNSLNTILPGDPWFDPGVGPIIQVPANQLAKSSPQMGEFLQWAKILPYGPQESSLEMLTPKFMKQAYEAYQGADPDNEQYQQAFLDIYNMKVAQWHEEKRAGKNPDPPSMDEIKSDAKKFLWLQVLSSWASPVATKNTPLTGTKYQFFDDQYRAMLARDPANAKSNFLAKFGEDYIGFTNSLTKSMGISASISADQQAEKYRDLIAEDPDMAPFIVGDIYNGGPFSASVYQKQLHDEMGGVRVREKITAEAAIVRGREQEGWSEYMGAVTQLDSALLRAGFKSYAQAGAENFAAAKRQITESIASQNPAWAKVYGTTDREKIPNRIRSFEQLVTDPKLANDPMRMDIPMMRAYLIVRNQFKTALSQRGLSEVSYDVNGTPTGEAADIGYRWRMEQMRFVNSSLAFGKVFNRYLSNDDLQ